MIILHVVTSKNDLCSGVAVAAGQYLVNQSKLAQVAYVNEKNEDLCDGVLRFEYNSRFKLDALTAPFDKPDIIIFHEMYSFAYLKIYKQALKKSIPYVIIPHGGLTKTAQRIKAYKKIPANILFSRFYNKANSFHYLTANEQKTSIFQNKSSFVVPNGIEKKE